MTAEFSSPVTMGDAICTLTAMFPNEWLEETARKTGLVKRERKITPVAMFWVLVLSYGISAERTLAAMKRDYQRETQTTLSDSSWSERFTPELTRFLHACVLRGIEELAKVSSNVLSERLRCFEDILIQDSTVIRLNAKLAQQWPPVRSPKPAAGVKLATLVSVVANGPKRLALYGERTAEIKTLRVGPWVKNRILLVDLGFFKHHLLARIEENEGFS